MIWFETGLSVAESLLDPVKDSCVLSILSVDRYIDSLPLTVVLKTEHVFHVHRALSCQSSFVRNCNRDRNRLSAGEGDLELAVLTSLDFSVRYAKGRVQPEAHLLD